MEQIYDPIRGAGLWVYSKLRQRHAQGARRTRLRQVARRGEKARRARGVARDFGPVSGPKTATTQQTFSSMYSLDI
jgi:hypothetical protein